MAARSDRRPERSNSVAGGTRGQYVAGFVRSGRILDDLLEHREVPYVTPLAFGREPAPGLGPAVLVVLGDRDEVLGGQQLQMTAQVSIGEIAKPLQVRKSQSLRMCDQR